LVEGNPTDLNGKEGGAHRKEGYEGLEDTLGIKPIGFHHWPLKGCLKGGGGLAPPKIFLGKVLPGKEEPRGL